MNEQTLAVIGGIFVTLWMIVTFVVIVLTAAKIKDLQEEIERLRKR